MTVQELIDELMKVEDKLKEAYPDNEIYQIKINEFILVDSIGIWYVNANMGVKEPYTEKQLVRLWSNYWREITYDNAK